MDEAKVGKIREEKDYPYLLFSHIKINTPFSKNIGSLAMNLCSSSLQQTVKSIEKKINLDQKALKCPGRLNI